MGVVGTGVGVGVGAAHMRSIEAIMGTMSMHPLVPEAENSVMAVPAQLLWE